MTMGSSRRSLSFDDESHVRLYRKILKGKDSYTGEGDDSLLERVGRGVGYGCPGCSRMPSLPTSLKVKWISSYEDNRQDNTIQRTFSMTLTNIMKAAVQLVRGVKINSVI
ncbi:hypothetical protein E5288_WYG014806 [Bos mutus]|uniref:Uncharacterized protein n=1 Tax=Bos mutus TaxID=72004 RepID=A0A6B0S8C5_9CETA|nr:hypothetical protein [Bos mutus]